MKSNSFTTNISTLGTKTPKGMSLNPTFLSREFETKAQNTSGLVKAGDYE